MIAVAALPRRLRGVGSSTGVGNSALETNFLVVTSDSSDEFAGSAAVSAITVTFCSLKHRNPVK